MKTTKIRNTNIEILRIVAMLLIIGSHLAIYGIIENPNTEVYVIWEQGTLLNKICTCLLVPGGDIGVGVFFLISGFFLSKKREIVALDKIIFEVFFYGITCTLFTIIFQKMMHVSVLSLNMIGKVIFLPITSNIWWFCTAYVFLIVCAPYINTLFMNVRKKGLLIIVIYVVGYTFGKVFDVMYYPFIRAVWFYLVGAFISSNKYKIRKNITFWVFLLSWFFYCGSTFMIGMSVSAGKEGGLLELSCKLLRSVVWGPVGSISLFLLFLDISMKVIPFINTIAQTTFGIYLVHEMPFIRNILLNHIFNLKKIYTGVLFPIMAVGIVFLIFLFGMLIDICRMKYVEPMIQKYFLKVKKRLINRSLR